MEKLVGNRTTKYTNVYCYLQLRHGGLKRGDQLLSVNGVSVEGEPHEKAVELLKAAKSSVKLVVRFVKLVVRFVKLVVRFVKQVVRLFNW